jgi:peptide/nickel transport system substrate-binding protein/oligopeptide transport system substrate-binding protein
MPKRRVLFTAGVAVGVALGLASAGAGSGESDAAPPRGGTFRIAFAQPEPLDTMDPAIANTQQSWALLDLTCARLMTYPDKPGQAAYRLVPEVAAAPPKVSRDGKTYTFILRHSFRFNDGRPVDARAFARAINRTLTPGLHSLGTRYMEDIVGARAVIAGRTQSASGVVASGYRLTIRLVQPLGDLPARTSMPFFCAVPPNLPPDLEGRGKFAGSGPYYVDEYRPNERIILKRNPYYGGKRRHYVDGFNVDLTVAGPQEILDRIEDGRIDWGITPPPLYFAAGRRLVEKYGLKGQFQVRPGFTFRGFALNMDRPLFRGNPQLRQAVNYAIDRKAFAAPGLGTRLTDQLLPPSLPGYRNAKIYPLDEPNLAKAKKLARGHLRGGKAVLYVNDLALTLGLGQLLKQQLAPIGLDVDVRGIPGAALPARLSNPGEPYDMTFVVTPNVDYYDPYAFLNVFFESRFIGHTNWSNLHDAKYNRMLRAAAHLRGAARARAYGELDIKLARDVAPLAAISYSDEPTLVSKRVGCVLLRPALDLATVCLKQR